MFVRGDDCVASGDGGSLSWFATRMEEHYECKIEILGPDKDDEKRVKVQNRLIISKMLLHALHQ